MSSPPEGDLQITLEFVLGLSRASRDADVREALDEIGDVTDALLRRFGDAESEDAAYRAIADFAIREARRMRAIRRDLSRKHFAQPERDLLENHPTGRELVRRLADGDESVVAPARELLDEIKRVRAWLGFDVT